MSRNSEKRKTKKVKLPPIRITELIAVNCTQDAINLLEKYGKGKPGSYEEVENKLTELYRTTTDKKQLEKEIAAMHPHKKFILDNVEPVPETAKQEIVIEPIKNQKGKLTVVDSGYSDYEGCNCNNCRPKPYSNACGCSGGYSGFNGSQNQMAMPGILTSNNAMTLIAMVGIVAIAAFVIKERKS